MAPECLCSSCVCVVPVFYFYFYVYPHAYATLCLKFQWLLSAISSEVASIHSSHYFLLTYCNLFFILEWIFSFLTIWNLSSRSPRHRELVMFVIYDFYVFSFNYENKKWVCIKKKSSLRFSMLLQPRHRNFLFRLFFLSSISSSMNRFSAMPGNDNNDPDRKPWWVSFLSFWYHFELILFPSSSPSSYFYFASLRSEADSKPFSIIYDIISFLFFNWMLLSLKTDKKNFVFVCNQNTKKEQISDLIISILFDCRCLFTHFSWCQFRLCNHWMLWTQIKGRMWGSLPSSWDDIFRILRLIYFYFEVDIENFEVNIEQFHWKLCKSQPAGMHLSVIYQDSVEWLTDSWF